MTSSRYPALFQFLAGYFHEDWAEKGESANQVVTAFAKGHSKSELAEVASCIEDLLAERLNDEALERTLFEELGCYYVSSADGLSANAWLRHLRDFLRLEAPDD